MPENQLYNVVPMEYGELIRIKELTLLILIILDIVLLSYISFYPSNPGTVNAINQFDLFLCIILFVEFSINLKRADNRRKFLRENWMDIIAFMPVDFFRAFRFIRILRVVKVLALFRKYLKKFFTFLVDTHLDQAVGILLFAIVGGTLFFYMIESGVNRSLHGPLDSLWYSITTTIVGEVVIPPTTLYGKAITSILMLVGVTFVGFLTASLASWFVKNPEEEKEIHDRIEKIEKSIEDLKRDIREIKDLLRER
ncbi:ion transporter [Methanothermobacter sp. K4]|uniref:ion transporter n=1 Tax=Methanothermobacter sp. K4 TaxID=2913262 RepID=UPI001EDAA834|nr:ion transporter [Methanothermobacter sp. K4]MCG2829275.1 ion transporter [Methanothermobacter sp. K4]